MIAALAFYALLLIACGLWTAAMTWLLLRIPAVRDAFDALLGGDR